MTPDISKYQEWKKKLGFVVIEKINDAYAVSVKRFDPTTGEEIEPQVVALSIESCREQVAQFKEKAAYCQKCAENGELLIADLEALG